MTRQIPRPAALLAVLLGALALTACSRAVVEGFNDYILTRDKVEPRYTAADLRFRHGGETMPVVVYGEGFGRDAPALAEAFAGYMTGHSPAVATTFVAGTAGSDPISRIAVQMSPPVTRTGDTLCAGEGLEETVPAADGRVDMLIAYCFEDSPRSSARLNVAARDLEAPPVRRGLALAARRLMPARDPNIDPPDPCQGMCN